MSAPGPDLRMLLADESRAAIEHEARGRELGRVAWCATCRRRHPTGFTFGGRWRPWHESQRARREAACELRDRARRGRAHVEPDLERP